MSEKFCSKAKTPDTIDQNRIQAKLEYGVLRMTLPKAAKAVPRQITVMAE